MGSSKELPKYIKSRQNQEGYARKQIFFYIGYSEAQLFGSHRRLTTPDKHFIPGRWLDRHIQVIT